jgi:hypothetical protein
VISTVLSLWRRLPSVRWSARSAGEVPIRVGVAPASRASSSRSSAWLPHARRLGQRLLQVVERARAHAVDRALDARVARHHDHLDLGPLALHAGEQIAAVVRAEAQVEQHRVQPGFGERRRHPVRALGLQHAMSVGPQDARERAQDQRLVVHDQHEAGVRRRHELRRPGERLSDHARRYRCQRLRP